MMSMPARSTYRNLGFELHYLPLRQKLEAAVDWQLDMPIRRVLR